MYLGVNVEGLEAYIAVEAESLLSGFLRHERVPAEAALS